MMKFKKNLILLLLVVTVGCSTVQQETATPVATLTAESVETASPTKIVPTITPTVEIDPSITVLEFWHPWVGSKADAIADLVETYNSENTEKVLVNVSSVSDDDYMAEQVEQAIASGDSPDLLLAPSWLLNQVNLETDLLLPLDDLVAEEPFFSEDKIRSFSASAWQQNTIDENRYAIPANYVFNYLFYNQTWAQELGFDSAPTTSEEFINQACTAARWNAFDEDEDNNGTGGYIYNTEPAVILSWLKAFAGGDISEFSPFDLNTKEHQNALEFLHQIYKLDCAWTGREDEPYGYFSNRNAIFYSGTSSDWQRQILIDEMEENQDDWTIIPYPGQDGNPIVVSELSSYAIFKTDEEKEQKTWNFLVWMLSEDLQASLVSTDLSVPVTVDAAQNLSGVFNDFPEWQKTFQFFPIAEVSPNTRSWEVIGKLFQDIAWQVSLFNVRETDIPGLLEALDIMANEVLDE